MTITLELPQELEAKLRGGLLYHDAQKASRLLADALIPQLEILLRERNNPMALEEFEILADQLATEMVTSVHSKVPTLSNFAISRESMYEDLPNL